MGPVTLTRPGSTHARHRAEVPRLARMRREIAHLLAGSDLYAADRELRPEVHRTVVAEVVAAPTPA